MSFGKLKELLLCIALLMCIGMATATNDHNKNMVFGEASVSLENGTSAKIWWEFNKDNGFVATSFGEQVFSQKELITESPFIKIIAGTDKQNKPWSVSYNDSTKEWSVTGFINGQKITSTSVSFTLQCYTQIGSMAPKTPKGREKILEGTLLNSVTKDSAHEDKSCAVS